MNDEQKPSFLIRAFSIIMFAAMSIGSLWWFFFDVFGLASQINNNSPVLEFTKGSMYMLGTGLGLLCLTAGGVLQGLLGMELTTGREIIFNRCIAIAFILVVATPQLAHYMVSTYAQKQQYSECEELTYHWMLFSKYYYTDNDATCKRLLNEKKQRLKKPFFER